MKADDLPAPVAQSDGDTQASDTFHLLALNRQLPLVVTCDDGAARRQFADSDLPKRCRERRIVLQHDVEVISDTV